MKNDCDSLSYPPLIASFINTKKEKDQFDATNFALYNSFRVMQKGGKSMDRMTVLNKVTKIISEKLGVNEKEITETSKLVDDLKADSLDLVDLVMALEEELGVKIDDSDLEKISTVKDVVDYIVSKS